MKVEKIIHHSFFFAMVLISCAFCAWVVSETLFGGYSDTDFSDSAAYSVSIILVFLWEYVSMREIDGYDDEDC